MSLALSQYALPLFIALFGFESKSLTMRGTISAILLSYIIIIRQSFKWFLILFSFYLLGMMATKLKSEEKKTHSLLQKTRGPWNVMGNASMAMVMALLGGTVGLIGFIGSIATATADTLSSEIGVLSKTKPYLITTFKKVPKGTNGGITPLGVASALLGSLITGLISLIAFNISIIFIAALAGLLGHFMDSYVGALLENGAHVGNSTTNLLATTSGAVFAMLIHLII